MHDDHGDVDCTEVVHTLYTYLDGELTSDRRIEIQQHLDLCPPCFEAFDFEAELRMVIARKCRDRVPEALQQRVADALRQMSPPPGGIPSL